MNESVVSFMGYLIWISYAVTIPLSLIIYLCAGSEKKRKVFGIVIITIFVLRHVVSLVCGQWWYDIVEMPKTVMGILGAIELGAWIVSINSKITKKE